MSRMGSFPFCSANRITNQATWICPIRRYSSSLIKRLLPQLIRYSMGHLGSECTPLNLESEEQVLVSRKWPSLFVCVGFQGICMRSQPLHALKNDIVIEFGLCECIICDCQCLRQGDM